jgi:excisionase family DNA binding protein
MSPACAKQTMTVVELADYLGASPLEVRRLFRLDGKRRFPGFKVGNKWCVKLEDVQDWLLEMMDERDA